MNALPDDTSQPSWTLADDRALLRRQNRNDQAVRFASILSAVALLLGAGLSVYAIVGGGDDGDIPDAPVDVLALRDAETVASVTYETAEIAAVAEPAIELIRYPWRSELQGWSITFLEPRGRASGYTWSRERHIEVFVDGSDDVDRVARVLAHELGHAVDLTLNDGDERRRWLAERGAPANTPWWPISGFPDFETGAGDFAEVFAAWQVGEDDFKSKVESDIDEGDYELLAELSQRGGE